MPLHTERELLLLISRDDQAAFTILLRGYWNKVYTQAISYLKSSELAQEITQDVFLKIWFSRERLSEVQSFSDYLFIISRNEIISALRKKNTQIVELPGQLEEVLLQPDKQLHYKESYTKMLGLIDQLPPTRKKVFMLSRLEGKSYEEIGTELGISRNGVKDHIVKALNFLRMHFNSHEQLLLMLFIATNCFSDNFS
ncbi:RNA polymerase sigma factor [Terrimonas pollutisoli]|uniref:RNA polymerase sigma factor n=1 Tax=Terrimonas pollutisoli TaxID=3034147 RepID=UPI0023ECED6B|nr:sigma-70 family RNA polymerase sigma factor [Terrimonas sp. H1YJ31]